MWIVAQVVQQKPETSFSNAAGHSRGFPPQIQEFISSVDAFRV